jgi:hypothetical protein
LHFVAPPLGRRRASIHWEFNDMKKIAILALPLLSLAACNGGGGDNAQNGANAADSANAVVVNEMNDSAPADGNTAGGKPPATEAEGAGGGKPPAPEGAEAGGKPTGGEAGNEQ